ncbi:MAG: hypothetical protein HC902_09720 [Calothrix sp. SM1_5_4]|nr:hypothetical protein [Calothrix sp. SM1_5_4]
MRSGKWSRHDEIYFSHGDLFFYLVYGLYLAQYDVRILPEELVADPPRGFFDYKGVTNVHTHLSSGSGDVPRVIAAAQSVGLDFLSVTDLNVFDKPSSLAGYHGGMLVMMDGEYSYLNSRLLNIGATSARHLQGVGRSQVLFADLLSQNERDPDLGSLILAHPTKARYRWSGEYPPGLDGIEIINLKNVWQEAWETKKLSFLMSLLIFPFNEKLALLRLFETPEEELHLWDELTRKRRVVGLAGADAEAKVVIGGTFLRFPSYETLLSLVRNHVLVRSELTGNATSDVEKLGLAFREGRFYMSLDILANPKGFNALIRAKNGQVFPMGAQVPFTEGMSLEVTLPQKPKVPFDTVIYRDGQRVMTSNSQVTEYFLNSPGVYRVMVRVIPTLPLPDGKKWIPWIFTNPFYVSQAGAGTRTVKPGQGGS